MLTSKETTYPWEKLPPKEDCCVDKKLIISVRNLTVQYDKKVALDGINLDINQGCITALVGPSGCGKSTLLLTLNRLVEEIPSATMQGDIQFDGKSVLSPSTNIRSLRSDIGLIFQKPNPFPFSIKKNLTLTLSEHGVKDRAEQDIIVEQSLRSVGLWDEVKDRLESSALKLSGGQQQRLCIARAIILKPKILLMDEPCSALDPVSSGIVEDLVSNMRGQYTIIIITHNLAQARRISDDMGVFWVKNDRGVLIEKGSTQDIFNNPKSEITKAYIGGIRG
ncbi:MAG: phosphate ABC transporter ATP-binding protein [Bdellovibrionaceae bacterium]|nr:phosphate ABC transporter ATP-binding protein [Pseudobdellovibrionaceae bacterium]|tara:strand:+ start:8457 stop:9293 length:837 start_codon:yes stop_codon:yes gene_type:complete